MNNELQRKTDLLTAAASCILKYANRMSLPGHMEYQRNYFKLAEIRI